MCCVLDLSRAGQSKYGIYLYLNQSKVEFKFYRVAKFGNTDVENVPPSRAGTKPSNQNDYYFSNAKPMTRVAIGHQTLISLMLLKKSFVHQTW